MTMRTITVLAMYITLTLVCANCTATYAGEPGVEFRLTNAANGKPLSNAAVTLADDPKNTKSGKLSFHNAIRLTTSTDGIIRVNLKRLKAGGLIIVSGKLFQIIGYRKHIVSVDQYHRVGGRLASYTEYEYNIKTKRVKVTPHSTDDEKQSEQYKDFTVIDIPMDG
jgi:hypothetical protein